MNRALSSPGKKVIIDALAGSLFDPNQETLFPIGNGYPDYDIPIPPNYVVTSMEELMRLMFAAAAYVLGFAPFDMTYSANHEMTATRERNIVDDALDGADPVSCIGQTSRREVFGDRVCIDNGWGFRLHGDPNSIESLDEPLAVSEKDLRFLLEGACKSARDCRDMVRAGT
ncbi:hypothetical protein FWD20_00435 [Candidatus Saccharibacteria bacterium]|nr:hypothetical protein [Candidatus Saccharibacteria bacterium]